jgi:hypothetical protein
MNRNRARGWAVFCSCCCCCGGGEPLLGGPPPPMAIRFFPNRCEIGKCWKREDPWTVGEETIVPIPVVEERPTVALIFVVVVVVVVVTPVAANAESSSRRRPSLTSLEIRPWSKDRPFFVLRWVWREANFRVLAGRRDQRAPISFRRGPLIFGTCAGTQQHPRWSKDVGGVGSAAWMDRWI